MGLSRRLRALAGHREQGPDKGAQVRAQTEGQPLHREALARWPSDPTTRARCRDRAVQRDRFRPSPGLPGHSAPVAGQGGSRAPTARSGAPAELTKAPAAAEISRAGPDG
eukprot:6176255-Pyramimonas_sp.AAC.1